MDSTDVDSTDVDSTDVDSTDVDSTDVAGQERELLLSLGLWAAASVASGVTLLRAGRGPGRGRPALTGIGRQAVIWGLIDGGIALWGAARGRRPADGGDPRSRAARLFALTSANALLDAGYLAGAVTLARRPRFRWDGIGMLPQATFLLILDARHAVGFLSHVRPRAPRGR
jgi:hypothetical protein